MFWLIILIIIFAITLALILPVTISFTIVILAIISLIVLAGVLLFNSNPELIIAYIVIMGGLLLFMIAIEKIWKVFTKRKSNNNQKSSNNLESKLTKSFNESKLRKNNEINEEEEREKRQKEMFAKHKIDSKTIINEVKKIQREIDKKEQTFTVNNEIRLTNTQFDITKLDNKKINFFYGEKEIIIIFFDISKVLTIGLSYIKWSINIQKYASDDFKNVAILGREWANYNYSELDKFKEGIIENIGILWGEKEAIRDKKDK